MNKDIEILSVQECPELHCRAVDYFSTKWGIDRKIYEDSISDSLTTENPTPRWYLMMRGDDIIGGYGLIENDFMMRKDLTPWLCALYVEESDRRQGLGSKLLAHGRQEAAKLGFSKVYLCTDHVGYYERYGWRFFGMEESEFGGETRVYETDSEEAAMNLTIKPLTPDLIPDYLDYFDNRAFSATDANGPCYCTSPMQTSEEIDQMVSEFGKDIKITLRQYAAKMLEDGKIHGYLAFDGDTVIGWCNADDMGGYVRNRYQFIPDFAYERVIGKIMSVVCFSVAPEYRGKGVSTALLERVLTDAELNGYTAVEGYIDIHKGHDDVTDFKGPVGLYKKLGFAEAARSDSRVVMRKILEEEQDNDRISWNDN